MLKQFSCYVGSKSTKKILIKRKKYMFLTSMDLENARELLHQMVKEVYSRP